MNANQATYPVRVMSRLLGVSASGFYAWATRPPSARVVEDIALTALIHAIHRRSGGAYGAPSIHAELADDHRRRVGKKRVARLMRAARLQGLRPRRFVTTTIGDPTADRALDQVDRQVTAAGPDRLWVADITYVPTWAGFLYLAIVLDVWSRRIVGWAMETHLRTELVLAALDMALTQRRPEAVVHHSDRGCQYTSYAFGKRCRDAGVMPSMGSIGDAYDNAMAPPRPRYPRATGRTHRRPRASSPRSSAKCSTGAGSAARPRRRWRSSSGWRAGTIRTVATRPSAIVHLSTTKEEDSERPLDPKSVPVHESGASPSTFASGSLKRSRCLSS